MLPEREYPYNDDGGGACMTLKIELTATEEARLVAAAQQEGMQPAELARKLVTDHLPQPAKGNDPTLALFAQWESEDARMTPEEMDQEQRLWEKFELGINETRRALGMREL
jgi:ribosome-binding protein aMBF1 (putative translation factor)